jgi:hypothetical protein
MHVGDPFLRDTESGQTELENRGSAGKARVLVWLYLCTPVGSLHACTY